MSHKYSDPRTKPVPPEIRDFVRRVVDAQGPTGASRTIGVSRSVVLAVVAGADVLPGTLALLTQAKHRVTEAA
jgi:hypothetical protein